MTRARQAEGCAALDNVVRADLTGGARAAACACGALEAIVMGMRAHREEAVLQVTARAVAAGGVVAVVVVAAAAAAAAAVVVMGCCLGHG